MQQEVSRGSELPEEGQKPSYKLNTFGFFDKIIAFVTLFFLLLRKRWEDLVMPVHATCSLSTLVFRELKLPQ